MNIHIMAPDGKARVRPDTTLNRFKEDYYVPDGIERIDFTPVVFAHISRAGKALSPRFVKRYYSALGFGIITFPDGEEFYDFTSLLSMVEIPFTELSNPDNRLTVSCNGATVCDISGLDFRALVEKAIVNCSSHTSLRIGDFVAAEMDSKKLLLDKSAGEASLKATFGEHLLFETRLSF